MYCSKCGKEIKDGSLFCDQCGTKVEPIEVPNPVVEETIDTTQEVVEENVTPVETEKAVSQDTEVKKEGVSEDRLNYIMGLLNDDTPKTEEVVEEPVVEAEPSKKEVDQERLDYIMGLLDEKEEKVEEPVAEEAVAEEPVITPEPTPVVDEPVVSQPVQEPVATPVQQTIIQEPTVVQAPVNTVDGNRVVTDVISKPATPKAEETKGEETTSKSYLGLISMIIGIACIPLAFIIKLWVLPIAIAGIIVGACHKGKDTKKVVGISLSAASIPIAVVVAIVAGVFGLIGGIFDYAVDHIDDEINTTLSTLTFEADGYTLEYDYNWRKISLERTDDEEGTALEYKYQNDILAPIGISPLSEMETGLDFDTSTKDGRDTLYEYFSEYWIEEGENIGKVVKEDQSFKKLKDDIYYATFTYGKDENTVKGHYILLISKESNAVISMQTNCSTEDAEDFLDLVLDLLDTIEIEKQDNVIVDNELAGALETMSAWNMYSDVRTSSSKGKNIDLDGTWKELTYAGMGWTFKDGEFWYYKSYSDTNDNYWYGTYEVYTGQDGLDKVGAAGKAKDIVDRSNGTVTSDSICSLVLKPTKIIINGEDQSSEMLPTQDWKYVWILINHGDDGIEGQVANISTGSTFYFLKTTDK